MRGPVVASSPTLAVIVRLVAVLVTTLVLILLPKSAVTPGAKAVFTPVTAMLTTAPCAPDVGVTAERKGVALETVNAPLSVTTSPPVLTTTLCAPTVAAGPTARSASRLVGPPTTTLPTLMPAPNDTVVAFCRKFVFVPVIFTCRLVACGALFGITCVSAAALAVTLNPCEPETANSPPVTTVTMRQPR